MDKLFSFEQLEEINLHGRQLVPWQMEKLAKQLADTMGKNKQLRDVIKKIWL